MKKEIVSNYNGPEKRSHNGYAVKDKWTLKEYLAIFLGIIAIGTFVWNSIANVSLDKKAMADVITDCEANSTQIEKLKTNNVQIKNDVAHLVKKTDIMDARQMQMFELLHEIKGKLQ